MIEEILHNLYRIEIPLPKSPLKSLNSYLIRGQGRYLLIDTGMNRDECMSAMLSALKRLDVDLEKTDFFITHLHADHLGLVSSLATGTSKIYFNEKEISMENVTGPEREENWQRSISFLRSNGFPEDELKKALERHPGRLFGLKKHVEFTVKAENDTIEIGDYFFRCIETPGHSPGHTCLYEADKKILVAGDHILFDITPNITHWSRMENSLQKYLSSLEKVSLLDINLVLPGHRRLMQDHQKRIRELREHHFARVEEVLDALKDGDKNVYQVAPWVTWDVSFGSWELFPPVQKWFAFGETLAHLEYLKGEGKVRREGEGGEVRFLLS